MALALWYDVAQRRSSPGALTTGKVNLVGLLWTVPLLQCTGRLLNGLNNLFALLRTENITIKIIENRLKHACVMVTFARLYC